MGPIEEQETDEGDDEEVGEGEMVATQEKKKERKGKWFSGKKEKKMNGHKSSSKNKERITKIIKLPIYPQRQL